MAPLTHQQQINLARNQLGYAGPFSGGQFTDFIRSQNLQDDWQRIKQGAIQAAPSPAGVRPVGVVEPLNPLERSAIQAIADYEPPQTSQAGFDYLQGLEPRMGVEAVTGRVEQFMNPFTGQVIDQFRQDLQTREDEQRAKLREAATRFGSYGARQDLQQAELTGGTTDAFAREAANLRFRGFDSAMQNALASLSQERSDILQGAGLMGDLGAQGQATFLQGQQARLNAGAIPRNLNQTMLDYVRSERARQIGTPQQRISAALPAVQSLAGGTAQPGIMPQQASGFERAIGGGLAGLSLGSSLQGAFAPQPQVIGTVGSGVGSAGGAALPWSPY